MKSQAELAIQIGVAHENLQRLRDATMDAEAKLIRLLCEKHRCHPGARVIRLDKSRREWIVTKAFLPHAMREGGKPWIWAKRADHHNSGNPHHERQLWWLWEPAP